MTTDNGPLTTGNKPPTTANFHSVWFPDRSSKRLLCSCGVGGGVLSIDLSRPVDGPVLIAVPLPERMSGVHDDHHDLHHADQASGSDHAPHAHHHGPTERLWLLIGTATCLAAAVAGALVEWRTPAELRPGWALGLYLLAYIAGGWETLAHAVHDLRQGRVNVDLLMIAAAVGSAALGNWVEGAGLLFLFALSHTLESYILARTRRAIAGLMQLNPDTAVRVVGDVEERVAVAELRRGDVIVIHPGERIAADGEVLTGQTSVDQSPVTGESLPVDKQPGDAVFSGTLNQQGVVHVRVSRAADESTLARMVQLVEQAQSERASTQRFSEWFGERYTWLVIGLSALTLLVPWQLGETFAAAFQRAMTVLVVASPCAVVISIPAAILAAITSAARGGVLFKGGAALEQAATLKAMAFDKTGTLTLGRPQVVQVLLAEGTSSAHVLAVAAALEVHSEHPLAKAVVREAERQSVPVQPAENVAAVMAHGVVGDIDGRRYRVGKTAWLADLGPMSDGRLQHAVQMAQAVGQTLVVIADEQHWLGALGIADTLRPTAGSCLHELRRLGLGPLVMLTGDSQAVARTLAERLELSFQADLLPDDKLRAIRQLRQTSGPTGMMGDGMNDAPSLAAATVGFSLGGAGADVALETADVVILADDLRRVPYAIGLARATQRIILQNLTLAFGMMAALLATTYFSRLPLPLAVLGHEGSTVLVILNGLRLLRYPRPPSLPGGESSAG